MKIRCKENDPDNLRLQLYLSNEETDILDDRGFDLCWYYVPQNV